MNSLALALSLKLSSRKQRSCGTKLFSALKNFSIFVYFLLSAHHIVLNCDFSFTSNLITWAIFDPWTSQALNTTWANDIFGWKSGGTSTPLHNFAFLSYWVQNIFCSVYFSLETQFTAAQRAVFDATIKTRLWKYHGNRTNIYTACALHAVHSTK